MYMIVVGGDKRVEWCDASSALFYRSVVEDAMSLRKKTQKKHCEHINVVKLDTMLSVSYTMLNGDNSALKR